MSEIEAEYSVVARGNGDVPAQQHGDEGDDDAAPWLRLAREPALDYGLFCRYLGLGERRTQDMLAEVEVAAEEGLHPAEVRRRIKHAARTWRWAERAARYDEYEAQKDLAALRRGRLAMRARRRALLERMADALRMQVEKLVTQAEGGEVAKLSEVVEALRLVLMESRKEYDDTPAERQIERLAPVGGRALAAAEITAVMMRIQMQAEGEA